MSVNTKIVKYKGRNVDQCWNCKNCVGFMNYKTAKGSIPIKVYVLPECEVEGLYMTHVNQNPCPYFDKRTEEFHVMGE